MLVTSFILPLISLLCLTSSIEGKCNPAPTADMGDGPAHYCLSKGYEWYSESCSCYKFHKDEVTWPAAYQTCLQEDARLAVPNSDQEAGLLFKIYHEFFTELESSYQIGFEVRDSLIAVGIYWDPWRKVWMAADGEIFEWVQMTTPEKDEMIAYAFMPKSYYGLTSRNQNMKGVFICEKKLAQI